MPIDVLVGDELVYLPMTDGRGEIADVPPDAHILIDPNNRVLRRIDVIETYRASRLRPN
jgi:hypothetical protein